jgi:amylosucrase
MMLFQSGIPVLYSGDEIGQTNDWDYKLDPNKVQDSRYLHRGRMPWEQVAQLENSASSQTKIFHALAKLETIRKIHPAFSAQADVWTFDTGSDHVLGIVRYHQGELLIGCFNFGQSDYLLKKYSRILRNLLTDEEYSQAAVVPGFDFVWFSAGANEAHRNG